MAEERTRNVRFAMTDDEWRRVRARCALEGVTVAEVIARLLREWLQEAQQRG
jgi:hypothetical protein